MKCKLGADQLYDTNGQELKGDRGVRFRKWCNITAIKR